MTTPGEVSGVIELLQTLPAMQQLRDVAWQLKMATIVGTSEGSAAIGVFDGDGINGAAITSVPLISLVDSVSVDDHVLVLSVPSSGNYIIRNGTAGNAPSQNSIYAVPDVQSHNTSSYINMLHLGGLPMQFTFVKQRNNSLIAVNFHSGGYSGAASCVTEQALNINNTDYHVATYLHNSASARHDAWGSSFHIPQPGNPTIPAGTYTVTLRWRRASGGSTINMDAFDLTTCLLTEAPPAPTA